MSHVTITLQKSKKYVINNNIENENLKYVTYSNYTYIFEEICYT